MAVAGVPLDELLAPRQPEEIERHALELLGSVVDSVPAYRAFLAERGVNPAVVRDLAGFSALPLVLAGEVFSEEWRSLIGERCGSAHPCYDSASLYGTADAGVLANETPLSIRIRRFLAAHPDAAAELFGQSGCPPWRSTSRPVGSSRPTTGPCGSPGQRHPADPLSHRRRRRPDRLPADAGVSG